MKPPGNAARAPYGRVPILIACNRVVAHTRDIPRYIGHASMPGVLRQTCLLLSCFPFWLPVVHARDRGLYQDGRLHRSVADGFARGPRQPGVLDVCVCVFTRGIFSMKDGRGREREREPGMRFVTS